jgi:ankyrin repeat protein
MKKLLALVVLMLVAGGSTYAQTTDFFELVRTGTPQSVQAAIGKGADIEAQDGFGRTPLMLAAYNQNPEVITTLLTAGADIKARDLDYGFTALMFAALFNQNPEATITLLKAGADINARDKRGGTVLMKAAGYNQNPAVITTLLEAGADIAARDEFGETPLMKAAERTENPEVIITLLKAGADAKAKDDAGKTAFAHAVRNENLKDTDAYWKLNEARY